MTTNADGPGVVGSAPPTSIWAIVPLRGLATAKTRLGPALDAAERLELVISMARRTLGATRDARRLSGTLLVTADPAAAELARGYGALTLVQRLPGLNAALREGRDEAARAGADATIIIPIDLPGINADAIDRLLDIVVPEVPAPGSGAAAASDPASPETAIVALVPDRHGLGTNILFTSPPSAIDPAFGDGSLAAHRAAARAVGAHLFELGGPLVLDVDTEDDLHVAASVGTRDIRRLS
ncbi:MAG: 2-phospho-L-lactate guanylyltransferase [Chloroflexota bacterium]